MLLDPERELLPAWCSTDVLGHLPATLVRSATAEPHACALEPGTGVHATVDGAAAELTARREPTFALHVHVAVPGREAAARALDGPRADLPALLARANSPFWQWR